MPIEMYNYFVQRTDLLDTSDKSWRMMLQLLRELTPEQRLHKALEHSESSRQFRKLTKHLRPGSNEP